MTVRIMGVRGAIITCSYHLFSFGCRGLIAHGGMGKRDDRGRSLRKQLER